MSARDRLISGISRLRTLSSSHAGARGGDLPGFDSQARMLIEKLHGVSLQLSQKLRRLGRNEDAACNLKTLVSELRLVVPQPPASYWASIGEELCDFAFSTNLMSGEPVAKEILVGEIRKLVWRLPSLSTELPSYISYITKKIQGCDSSSLHCAALVAVRLCFRERTSKGILLFESSAQLQMNMGKHSPTSILRKVWTCSPQL